jgi:hypothetical protein
MANYIPFITSHPGRKLVKTHYDDAEIARVSLDSADQLIPMPGSIKTWIDPGVDGLDDLEVRRSRPERKNSWYEHMKTIAGFDRIADPSFVTRPDKNIVKTFVQTLLDKCVGYEPTWMTVPQLPIVNDASRNKINRALAQATGEWKSTHSFSGRLILPLVFKNQKQINGKTERNGKVSQAGRCYHEAQADGFWVVDSSLTDESGSRTLRNTRFPGIVALHQELNKEIASTIRIAGPYWGMNLVLWARGLVDYPAIGVGNSYQYFPTGGTASTPATRVAISPLRRRASVAQLRPWLTDVLLAIGSAHPAFKKFESIQRQLTLLSDPDAAREQVAKFYRNWLDFLALTPPTGRSLALYQDLSAAYALGKSLPELRDEGTARRPESVVEPLMLSCL